MNPKEHVAYVWFICTKNFTCLKCGKKNSVILPQKVSSPTNKNLILLALKDQPLQCECGESLPSTDDWDIVEATFSEAKAFNSNPKTSGS
jgi:hypothetical protein